MTAELAAQRREHDGVDPHVHSRWLSDVILGMQDGLVNTLGVVLGVAAASANAHVTFAAGAAAGVAEAVSMAGVAYTSSSARGDLFRAERAREYRHIERVPDVERAEIRRLYEGKGFAGALLDRVVDTICANKDVWVAVMMAEEHGLAPVDRRTSLRSAVIVGVACLLGATPPVVPYLFFSRTPASAAAVLLGGAALFALGAWTARVTTLKPLRSGLTLAAIGMASALVGYAIGALLGVSP